MIELTTDLRARRHAALGDPSRLAVVDELALSDRSPVELQAVLGIPSNLLAHHLAVLEEVGLVVRHRSSGDGRRRYVHLVPGALASIGPRHDVPLGRALFVCTHNSARSQLAAVLWERLVGQPATSAGTQPATAVHPGAIASARRAGLDLEHASPGRLDDVVKLPKIVITVCDRAHEDLADLVDHGDWLHWSIPDPVPVGTRAAFDSARDELRRRIEFHTSGRAA